MPVFLTNWKFLAEAWRAKCSPQSGSSFGLLPEGVIAFLLWAGEGDLGLPKQRFEARHIRLCPPRD